VVVDLNVCQELGFLLGNTIALSEVCWKRGASIEGEREESQRPEDRGWRQKAKFQISKPKWRELWESRKTSSERDTVSGPFVARVPR
jgi:hypothetical protein